MRPKTLQPVMLSLAAILASSALAQPNTDTNADTTPPETVTDRGSDDLSGLLDLSRWEFRGLKAHWANDGTPVNLSGDTDEYFTNGTEIALSFDPGLSPALAERLAISDDPNEQRFGIGVGIERRMYTPSNLTLLTPPPGERPFAGYFAFTAAFQRADANTHDHVGFDIGVVGEASFAEDLQTWIHDTVFPNEIDPDGWEGQIPDEVVFNLAYYRTWKTDKAQLGDLELELLPRAGVDAGTVTVRGAAEMTARLGFNLPDDFGPASLLGITDHTAPRAPRDKVTLYAYATLATELVFHDIFIEGTVFNDESFSASREPFVYRISVGAVAQWHGFYFGWTQNFESERFKAQPATHTYGEMVFGWSITLK